MAQKTLGIALGSGGARGWCHIGVLRALQEMDIHPDVIAGSSMGSIVGAAYAGGCLDELERWVLALTWRHALSMVDMRFSGGGLIGGAEVVAMLEEIGLTGNLEDLTKPFIAVAADVQSGKETWLQQGNAALAVQASAAIPGVFSPKRFNGQLLIDGGVVNPVPVSAARALGADVVIAVNPNGAMSGTFWQPKEGRFTVSELSKYLPDLPESFPESLRKLWEGNGAPKAEPVPSYIELIGATIDIMSDQIRRSRLAGDAPQVMLSMQLPEITILEFHRAAEAIEEGRRVTLAQESWIRACLAG